MRKFLVHLQRTLTTDTALSAVLPPDHIGASVRQNAKWPCLEYGIDGQPVLAPEGKTVLNIIFQIYSTVGASECWEIEESLTPLLKPHRLSQDAIGFTVSRMQRVDAQSLTDQFSDWRYRLKLDYLTHIVF